MFNYTPEPEKSVELKLTTNRMFAGVYISEVSNVKLETFNT
jgi:hypothetical protein